MATKTVLQQKVIDKVTKLAIARELDAALNAALLATGARHLLRHGFDTPDKLTFLGFQRIEDVEHIYVKETVYLMLEAGFSTEVSLQLHSGTHPHHEGLPRATVGTPGQQFPVESARVLHDLLGRATASGGLFVESARAAIHRFDMAGE